MFNYKSNKNVWKLYVIILAQYTYLILFGFINIEEYTVRRNSSEFLIFYGLNFIVFLNLIFLQKLKANALIVMFFTSSLIIIYSLFEIKTSYIKGI